jgi:hypothetical protein
LTEFKKGPCSPIVTLPGIAGSKLRAIIDCKVFKANDPQGFEACGWKTCIGIAEPKKEYKIWIAEPLDPMSIYIDTEQARTCFAAVFGFDSSQVAQGIIKPKPGITVTPEGTSPQSQPKSAANCGAWAMENLQTIPQGGGSYYFKKFRETAENAGWVIGLTYQPLPYDFRWSYTTNELNTRFKGVITELAKNLGKKVTIYAHSFGNLNTIHNLVRNMSQQDKDAYVARFVSIAAPFLGSPRAFQGEIGLDATLAQDLVFTELGIVASMQVKTVALMKGLFNLMPKNTFKTLANNTWMRALKQRITAEKEGKRIDTDTVMNMFPQPVASCNPGFSTRDEFCNMGFIDFTVFGKVEDQEIEVSTAEAVLKKYGIINHADAIWKSAYDNLFDELPNPGVQTNIVYSSTVQTMSYFEFDENPKHKTSQGKYVEPTFIKTAHGDGTVLSASSIIPGVKWADDWKKRLPGAKPVNIIEMCSTYNRRPDVFSPGKKTVDENAYFGIDCECAGTRLLPRDGERCNHTLQMVDNKIIEFLIKSGIDGNAAIETPASQAFFNKSESQLSEYENMCLLLNNN